MSVVFPLARLPTEPEGKEFGEVIVFERGPSALSATSRAADAERSFKIQPSCCRYASAHASHDHDAIARLPAAGFSWQTRTISTS